MKNLTSAEIRNQFIQYYKKNGHTHVASSSLVPENDPTLLFTNAGMNQFKNAFLGLEKRDYTRAVSSQKCVRAGGKHNDLDNVGFTARHHTFFEMLGNFSFGDYFKKEAIHFAWELLTKELGIPKEKLYVTCFTTDDEAADIWNKQEGVPKERIFRFGKKDNFWRMGDTGPCGPCTEIFYDHGPKAGKESDPFKGIAAGEDRFVEIWNLVFMQFYEEAPGKMTSLPKPSVDTGSGLERLVAAIQGQYSNYDTDLFSPMIDLVSQKTGIKYITDPEALKTNLQVAEQVAAMRVLADHCRSTSFLIADGALPSNEGRGYVLRRIMRRAIRYSRKLSTAHSFLPLMSDVLISHMGSFYPELIDRKDHILATIKDEESKFLQTLDHGSAILHDEITKIKKQNLKVITGETVFKLYDTYGFPVDLTALIAAESDLRIDEAGFEKVMSASKEKARSTWKGKGLQSDEKHLLEFTKKHSQKPTVFLGYDALVVTTPILALSNGQKEVSSLKTNEEGLVIFSETPFYAEGGGQVGDHGMITTPHGRAQVHSCIKHSDVFVHSIEVIQGEIKLNDPATLQVETLDRRQTASNHSATHLMHSALKKVLGSHVNQAGSLVDHIKTRFDFTHAKPLTQEEIKNIEQLVNDEISKANEVTTEHMSYSDAISKGAVALFGEKYEDTVRVLTMGDFSCELCGGTHVKNTAQVRAFKIISESGVSSGVRRIEAITGDSAIQYLMEKTEELNHARAQTGITADKPLPTWIEEKKEEIKDLQKQIKKAQSDQIDIAQLVQQAKSFESTKGKAKLVLADLDLEDRDVLSQISDQIKNKIERGVVVVVGQGETSHPVIISVTKDLNPQVNAGQLLKDFATVLGGKGGGRPDFAQGAVPDRSKLADGFKKIEELVIK